MQTVFWFKRITGSMGSTPNHMGAWSKNVYVSQSGSNLQIPHSKIDYPQCHSLVPWPCPLADKEKGLVTTEWFLGCVNSAVLILYKGLHACMTYIYIYIYIRISLVYVHACIVSLACPKSALRGWGLGVRLTTPWQERPDVLVCNDQWMFVITISATSINNNFTAA